MGKFILGVIVTLIVIFGGFYVSAKFGFISTRADIEPTSMEKRLAMSAMDASTERRAPKEQNPIEPSDANLLDGVKIYKNNCALCHGSAVDPESTVGISLYPRAPQFMKDPADMPENQNFYIIKHGIRWTGMPAWEKVMSDPEIWKVVSFLSRMDKLPPAVDMEWKKPATLPRTGSE